MRRIRPPVAQLLRQQGQVVVLHEHLRPRCRFRRRPRRRRGCRTRRRPASRWKPRRSPAQWSCHVEQVVDDQSVELATTLYAQWNTAGSMSSVGRGQAASVVPVPVEPASQLPARAAARITPCGARRRPTPRRRGHILALAHRRRGPDTRPPAAAGDQRAVVRLDEGRTARGWRRPAGRRRWRRRVARLRDQPCRSVRAPRRRAAGSHPVLEPGEALEDIVRRQVAGPRPRPHRGQPVEDRQQHETRRTASASADSCTSSQRTSSTKDVVVHPRRHDVADGERRCARDPSRSPRQGPPSGPAAVCAWPSRAPAAPAGSTGQPVGHLPHPQRPSHRPSRPSTGRTLAVGGEQIVEHFAAPVSLVSWKASPRM